MPEGDTLFRTAAGLRPHLLGRTVTAARARVPGPQVERIVGATVGAVDAVGKNLLIRFDNGLELRTHLRMHGSWHRYRPGEPWRRPAGRAVLVLEVPGAVAVCFDAPAVELLETRAEGLHPPLAGLGPDATADGFDRAEALRRLRAPARAGLPVAEALLDQRAIAGVGNVYKSEVLFVERVDPFAPMGALDDTTVGRLVNRARAFLLANRESVARVTTGFAGAGAWTAAPARGWSAGAAAVGLPQSRAAVPPVWDACPGSPPRRPAADHLLVPALPGRGARARGDPPVSEPEVDVRCGREGDRWLCLVRVREGPVATEHRVTVAQADLVRLDPAAADPEHLVRAAFDFLLEREPASSILRSFDLPVIGRYFRGWEDDVRDRLA